MIGVQLHTYAMERLNRWVIYCLWRADLLTPQPGPRDVKSWWFTMVMAPNVKVARTPLVQRKPCPVDEIEAGITELCIQQLPMKLRNVVVIGSLSPDTAEEKSLELGCDRATYFRRMNRAYAELLGLFQDYEAGIERVDVKRANGELIAIAPIVAASTTGAKVEGGERKPALMRGIARTS